MLWILLGDSGDIIRWKMKEKEKRKRKLAEKVGKLQKKKKKEDER